MVTITVQIPDDVYTRLRAAAERSETAVDQFVVSAIEDALIVRQATVESAAPPSTRAEEMRRLWAAMGSDVEDIDIDAFPPELRPPDKPVDHAALRASMPCLDPPLSATIAEEREDRI